MKAMMLISNVLLVVSMVAAFTVVSVATSKILRFSYSRGTSLVLSIGVTVMALVGTGPVIVGPSWETDAGGGLFPGGGALILLPFLTLAVSRLFCEFLVAANQSVLDEGSQSVATKAEV